MHEGFHVVRRLTRTVFFSAVRMSMVSPSIILMPLPVSSAVPAFADVGAIETAKIKNNVTHFLKVFMAGSLNERRS